MRALERAWAEWSGGNVTAAERLAEEQPPLRRGSAPARTCCLARLSFPFFFDPGFDVEVKPITPGTSIVDDRDERWDGDSVHEFRGTYGEYVLKKVSRVFPELGGDNL